MKTTTLTRRGERTDRDLRVPAVDIYEREDGLVLIADLPGVKEEDLDVTVEGRVLRIEGRVEPVPESVRTHVDELAAGDGHREFGLSEDLDASKVRASLRHGVLRIELPKSDRLRPRSIPIHAG